MNIYICILKVSACFVHYTFQKYQCVTAVDANFRLDANILLLNKCFLFSGKLNAVIIILLHRLLVNRKNYIRVNNSM